jgi:hypothetical protein
MLTIAFARTPFHERVGPFHYRRDREIPDADRTSLVRPGLPFGRTALILSVPPHDTKLILHLHPVYRSQPGF